MSRLTTIFLLTSLIFVSGLVRAGEFQVSSSGSKVVYKTATDDFKAPSGRSWSQIINFGEYESTQSLSGKVRHTPSGAVSAQSISGGVKLSVARQTVLKNLLTKSVAGGRAVAGLGSGPVGWALTAATAYQLVAPTLQEHGYVWDSTAQNFVTDKEYVIEITPNADMKDSEGKKVVLYRIGLSKRSYDYGYESYKSTLDALCNKAAKDVDDYMEKIGYGSHKSKQFLGSSSTGGCNTITGWGSSVKAFWNIKPNGKQPITQSQFNDIIGPRADADPTRYVNATADDKGVVPDVTVSDKVTVPNGTVVTIGPYTDSDGQPKQVTVTFTTKNGETTVSVNTTPRPDLSPNSSSAPSASPNTGGQSSPSGSPNSSGQSSTQTGGQTGSQTGGEASPQTGGQTSGQTGSEASPKTDGEPDKKDEDKPKDGSFLCNLFPDILACDKQPEAGEEPSLEIPEKVVNVDFQPASVFSETAECPAPVQFTISIMGSSQVFAYSYEKPCMVAERLRYLLMAMAWVVAGFFCIRTVSREI